MILVTGGRGFVGRHLVRRLRSRGERVRILTREAGATDTPPGVEVVRGDLLDRDAVARAVAGATAVVHLAARIGGPADEQMAANVDGSAALAAASREAGVERFIHCSSASIYGFGDSERPFREDDIPAPRTAYGRSKLSAEHAVREELSSARTRWTILRPTEVYGPGRPSGADMLRQVARRRIWLHGPTLVLLRPTYVADLVTATELALQSDDVDGAALNVAGERTLSYREYVDEIAKHVGVSPIHFALPPWTASVAAGAFSLLAAVGVSLPERVDRLVRRLMNLAVDITRIRTLLGFTPTPLSEGLAETFRSGEGVSEVHAAG